MRMFRIFRKGRLCWLIACTVFGLSLIFYVTHSHVRNAMPLDKFEQTINTTKMKIFISAAPKNEEDFYMFNDALSDRIGAFRTLPDTRDARCSERQYYLSQSSSKVSVIIVFHNEARSTLLRTLTSLLSRTPLHFLQEIILLDDYSKDVEMLSELLPLLSDFSRTRLIRMHRNIERLGLIASRNRGADMALGHYLLFLDSHCEVNVGWLEPLLDRVTDKTAVSPPLDIIDARSFEYRASSKYLMGGFDWSLHFHWVSTRHLNDTAAGANIHMAKAFRSPAFSGGIFMISRNWFFKLNGFNPLLELWGGESIEMSIKLWLCGGQIEIVPCSRVGHVFRKQHPFHFPHGDNGQTTYLRNSKIIAESWLDDYKYVFYATKPSAQNVTVSLDLTELAKFKQHLQCRPFAWYLSNVFGELKIPNDEYVAYGQLISDAHCLHLQRSKFDNSFTNLQKVRFQSCYNHDVTEWFLERESGRLRTHFGACLMVIEVASARNRSTQSWQHFEVFAQQCETRVNSATQRWLRRDGRLVHENTQLCLDSLPTDGVVLSPCRRIASTQLFRFTREWQEAGY